MHPNWTIYEILDFLHEEGRFREAQDYIGMSASSTPKLFADYLRQLPAPERVQVAQTLTDDALGEVPELAANLGRCMGLVLSLCIGGLASEFLLCRDHLEAEFNDPENITCWLQATDKVSAPFDGPAFKAEYRYALALSGALILTKAPQIEHTYQHLTQSAMCVRFREALTLNKVMFRDRFVDAGSVLVISSSRSLYPPPADA